MLNRKSWLYASVALLFAAPATGAVAQTAQAPVATADRTTGLDEVVVFARKRGEAIIDVPQSITAYSGEQLAARSIKDIAMLTQNTPNIQFFGQASNQATTYLFMRGIGTASLESSADPAVAVFIDGAYQSRNGGGLQKLYDVTSVEVSRGPQDSIAGRNAFAGALMIRSQAPILDEVSGYAEGTVANYKSYTGEGAINIPLVEGKLAARIAGQYRKTGGFTTNLANGDHINGLDVLSIRPSLLWQVSDDVSLRLTGKYLRDKSDATTPFNASIPGSLFARLGYPGKNPFGDYTAGLAGDGSDPFTTYQVGFPNVQRYDVVGATSELNYTVPTGVVTWMTNYEKTKDATNTKTDGTPINLFGSDRNQHFETYQSELRYVSESLGKHHIVAGAFYFHDKYDLYQAIRTGFGNAGNPTATPPIAPVPVGVFAADPRTFQYGTNGQKRYSLAAFMEYNYDFTDKLTGTVGLRYSYEKKSAFALPYNNSTTTVFPFYDPAKFCAPQVKSWKALSPRLGLDYKPNDDVKIYASWQRGYKSGGFSTAAAGNCNAFNQPFDQEKVDNYETGLKGKFLDNRLTVLSSVFYAEYSNLQRSITRPAPPTVGGGFIAIISNAAGARIYGVELESSLAVTPDFNLHAQVGYLNSAYKGFNADLLGTGTVTNNDYLKLVYAPKWDYHLSADYRFDLSDMGSLTARAQYNHTAYMETSTLNQISTDRAPMTTIDASLVWQPLNDAYRVQLFGRNLTNNVERIGRSVIGSTFAYELPTDPRTYGVTLTYKF